MERVPYTNHRAHGVYIGTTFIKPGETRPVDASLIPAETAQEPAQAAPTLLEQLPTLTVPKILEALPPLSLDEIEQLIAAERTGRDRKTLIEALELARLEKIDQQEQAEMDALAIKDRLANLSPEELIAELQEMPSLVTAGAARAAAADQLAQVLGIERTNLNREPVVTAILQALEALQTPTDGARAE